MKNVQKLDGAYWLRVATGTNSVTGRPCYNYFCSKCGLPSSGRKVTAFCANCGVEVHGVFIEGGVKNV